MIRPRVLAGLVALAGLLVVGVLAGAQTGGETVATQTFTHEDVVTYTIPTETVVSTQTVTETVTITTTEPPTTEPPPPEGTTVTLVDQRFVCTGPLEQQFGPLPITLEQTLMNTSAAAQHVRGAIALDGCVGDGDPSTIDLIVHQYGNGRDIGPGWDALVSRLPTRDLNITGFLNCGYLAPGAHQDGADIRGATRVTFEDMEIGDWDNLFPTCHGAGALFYPSGFQNGGPLGNRSSDYVVDVVCIRCKAVGSKGFYDPRAGAFGTAAGIYESVRSGAIDSCFAAHRPWILRLDDGSRTHGAIDPVNVGNLLIDTDAALPQPSPEECEA